MSDQNTHTASELLAEWKELEIVLSTQDDGDTDLRHVQERMAEISRALDKMCEDVGLELVEAGFNIRNQALAYPRGAVGMGIDDRYIRVNIPATEFVAIFEWLLIRQK